MSESVHRLHELLAVMDVPRLAVPGVEADDVIGTMATRGVAAGMEVAVASPDKVGAGGWCGCLCRCLALAGKRLGDP